MIKLHTNLKGLNELLINQDGFSMTCFLTDEDIDSLKEQIDENWS